MKLFKIVIIILLIVGCKVKKDINKTIETTELKSEAQTDSVGVLEVRSFDRLEVESWLSNSEFELIPSDSAPLFFERKINGKTVESVTLRGGVLRSKNSKKKESFNQSKSKKTNQKAALNKSKKKHLKAKKKANKKSIDKTAISWYWWLFIVVAILVFIAWRFKLFRKVAPIIGVVKRFLKGL